MTPLTTEAAILAYLGRHEKGTHEQLAGAVDKWRGSASLYSLMTAGYLRSRKSGGVEYYRLSAAGRRLLAKHKATVAAAYGLEG